MKHVKTFYILVFISLFAFACGNEESVNEDAQEATGNDEELAATIDSLHKALANFQTDEKELQTKYEELEAQINEKSDEPETKIVYKTKTKVEYKTDESTLADLEAQRKKVKDQLVEIKLLKANIAKKENDLTKMTEEVSALGSNNEKLFTSSDVDVAVANIIKTQLTVSDIDIELYTRRVEDKEKKYLFIEIIETSFTINENKFTPKGDKVVYLCIYDKNHKILAHTEKDTFKALNGNTIRYSTKDEFSYDEDKLRMTVLWEKNNIELEPGKYTTEFYIDNSLAGVGTFDVQ